MMKRLILLIALVIHVQAHAADPEDAAEFLQPIPESELLGDSAIDATENSSPDLSRYPGLKSASLEALGIEQDWAFQFMLIRKDGRKEILTQHRSAQPMKPASTLKLFTGWLGFTKRTETNASLAMMLHWSDNEMAKDTLRRAGGAEKMLRFYEKIGLPMSENHFVAVDGSGLSHKNRTTVDLEMDLLEYIHAHQRYSQFKKLLAQPGKQGTLKKRLSSLKGRLFAKTGTLWDTYCLAGFVELGNGTLVFSILSNNIQAYTNAARLRVRNRIDQVVKKHVALARKL